MILFNRTADIAQGKNREALQFAQLIADHMRTRYGMDLDLLLPVGGNPNRIAWIARLDSMASLDAIGEQLLNDSKYWDAASQYGTLLLPGSLHDSFWRVLPEKK